MVKRDKKLSLFFYTDIYNKLHIMIKQTWEISNEERNRILSLHESATKNFYLVSEQPIKTTKFNDVDVVVSSRDPKVIQRLDEYSLIQWKNSAMKTWQDGNLLKKAGLETKTFNNSLNDMKKMMDEKSLQVFEKMENENPKFYYYVIIMYMGETQRGYVEPRKEGIFDRENAFYGLFDTERSTIKNKKIIVDDSTTIESEMSPGKTEPQNSGIEQGYELITPPTIQQPAQFDYNEAVMTPGFIEYINKTVFGGIDEAIKAMSDTMIKNGRKPAGVQVNKLKINASSSTIPNGVSKITFPGKVPTFQELSDERAKVVYNYLIEGLKKRNATINPEGVEINTKGTNAGKQITVNSGNQTLKLDGTGTSGPEYKGQNKEEFKKYQRVDLTFEFAVKGETPPLPIPPDNIPPELKPTSQTDFVVRFTAQGKKGVSFNFKLPSLKSPYYNKQVQTRCFYY
jgi:hypothetical protein